MYCVTPRGKNVVEFELARDIPTVFEHAQYAVLCHLFFSDRPKSQVRIVEEVRSSLRHLHTWSALQLQATHMILNETDAVLAAAGDRGWIQCMEAPVCK
jgi:hypothetical protein